MGGIGVLIKIYIIKPQYIDIDIDISRSIAIALPDEACKKSKAEKNKDISQILGKLNPCVAWLYC